MGHFLSRLASAKVAILAMGRCPIAGQKKGHSLSRFESGKVAIWRGSGAPLSGPQRCTFYVVLRVRKGGDLTTEGSLGGP